MNVDEILGALNGERVDYLLIGGMNFLLRHRDSKSEARSRPRFSEPPMNWDRLKHEEERKRDATYDPAARWIHIQQTITWAEATRMKKIQKRRAPFQVVR